MSKILLVEDDQNLSEIYNARLTAEGYEVIDAANGEDALAIAAKEKPDLVISDVMMPRVSGFEMLDILKHTDGMQGVKIIMLTALGQDNDRSKASELGADRYLVKSQVTLEDIVNAAKELLGDAEPTSDEAAVPAATAQTTPTPAPSAPVPPAQPPAMSPTTEVSETSPATPLESPAPAPAQPDPAQALPIAPSPVAPVQPTSLAEPAQATPAPDPTPTTNLAVAEPIAEEEAELNQQLNNSSITTETQPTGNTGDAPTIGTAPATTPEPTDTLPPQTPPVAAPSVESPAPASDSQNTPNSPEPESSDSSSADSHDEVLAAALKELESEQPTSRPPAQPTSQARPDTDQPKGSRRVIMPPSEGEAKPDVNELLANEGNEITNADNLPPSASNPTQPGPTENSQASPTDPGSISL